MAIDPTRPDMAAFMVANDIRAALKNRIGEVDKGWLHRVGNEVVQVLRRLVEQGLIGSPMRDISFTIEAKSPPSSHNKEMVFKPDDFYSALALQFARGGIPLCNVLPPKAMIGESWKDPAGNRWSFKDGNLICEYAQPLNFINMTFEVQPEHVPPPTPEVEPTPFKTPVTEVLFSNSLEDLKEVERMSEVKERPARAPVQEERVRGKLMKPAGTVSWEEHVEAWKAYNQKYHGSQTAERIAERGGFGYQELVEFLGREPGSWLPRS